jgi:hypothetical protein
VVSVHIVVLWVVVVVVLYSIGKRLAGSFFRVKMSGVRMWSSYIDRLQERWPLIHGKGRGDKSMLWASGNSEQEV